MEGRSGAREEDPVALRGPVPRSPAPRGPLAPAPRATLAGMRVERPRRFLDARAWRARVLVVIGILLLVQGMRVVALELLWGRTERCTIRSSSVRGEPGAYVVALGVALDDPTCILN